MANRRTFSSLAWSGKASQERWDLNWALKDEAGKWFSMHLKEIYEFRSPHRDVIPRSTVGSSCWILFLFLMCHGWSRQVTSVENCWYWPGREKEEGISDGGNSCNQRGKVGKHKLLYQERQARNRLIYLVDISAWKAAEKFRFYTLHNGEPLVVFEVF